MEGSNKAMAQVPRMAYWALTALFVMNLLNYIDRYILAAVMSQVQKDLTIDGVPGINDEQGGYLGSAFLISYSVFSPFIGWMGDRWKRKYLLAAGVGIWSLATFGSGMATTYSHMFLARSIMGIGEATYATLAPTIIADLFTREKRNRMLSIFYVAIPIGSALGYGIGAQVSAGYGWPWAFYVVGLPGFFVALAALGIPEPKRGASEEVAPDDVPTHGSMPTSWQTYKALFRNRSYLYDTLGMAFMTFAVGGLAIWTPKFLETHRDMSQQKAGTYTGIMLAVGGLLGTILGSWLADKYAGRVRGAYFWVCGLATLAGAPFIFLTIVAQHELLIFASMGVGLTLVFAYTGPSNTIIVNVTPPNMRAAAFAVNIFAIHILGDIPSPPLMGMVSDWTRDSFWGLVITVPALVMSGIFYCVGSRYLESDQEAMIAGLRGRKKPA